MLTIGQFVFALGGLQNKFWLMLVGRAIFGLGGECMSVAQSAIVSRWFKGKELSFAFGLNLSVARLGSVLNGIILPRVAQAHDNKIGEALFIGFGVCLFSLFMGICLCVVDYWADKKDGVGAVSLGDEDKFKFKDITEFKLPYWLITLSCMVVYMCIFPYLSESTALLTDKFGFDPVQAGELYGIPYFISAFLSPILGFMIDKVGKRALFIMTSSILVCVACIITAVLPVYDHQTFICLIPQALLGFGYSVYAAALWGSIPYVVAPRTIGTAFGLTTAVQNTGLTVAYWAQGYVTENTSGFVPDMLMLAAFALCGFLLNIWLYFDDIRNRGSVLNNVDKGETLEELMTSPVAERKTAGPDDLIEGEVVMAEMEANEHLKLPNQAAHDGVDQYADDQGARDALKRSMAKQRPTQ